MASDKPESIKKWRNTTAQTLTAAAFAQKVLEYGLRVIGPYEGYIYCAQESDDGYDLFRTFASWENATEIETASADPAAGAASVTALTVASGTKQRVVGISITYVRDANAANVVLRLAIADGTRNVVQAGTTTALTASKTWIVTWGIDLPNATWNDGTTYYITAPLPKDFDLLAGYSAVIWFDNKQATDNAAPAYTHSRVVYTG